MAITVSIVEDDPRIRKNLCLLIDGAPGFRCIAGYPSGEDALKSMITEAPDVVLMDINLPGMSGVECVRKLRRHWAQLNIVMLTVYEDSDLVFQALQAGATGYLLKRATSDEIITAIKEVLNGGAPMSSHIARKVVQSFRIQGNSREQSENLTQREEEILDCVVKGYINKEIADKLHIGSETVRSHLKSIYQKFHVRSRTEAAVKYLNQ